MKVADRRGRDRADIWRLVWLVPLAALSMPVSALAQTKSFAVQVEPSAPLAKAVADGDHDEAMTLARREHVACLEDHQPAQCLELLAIQSDAETAWMERFGDVGRDMDPAGEGFTLKTTRRLKDAIEERGVTGFNARIFTAAYGNYGVALTEQGLLVEGEEVLRSALQYQIVDQQYLTGRERDLHAGMRIGALRLARNLALQGDYAAAKGFLEAADYYLFALSVLDDPRAEEARIEYLAVAALIPEFLGRSGKPSWIEADVGYSANREHVAQVRPDLLRRFDLDHATFLARTGRPAEAIALLTANPALLEGQTDVPAANAQAALGGAYLSLGDPERARELLEPATRTIQIMLAPSDFRRIAAETDLGLALLASVKPDPDGAARELRQAVSGAEVRILDTETTADLVIAVRTYRPAFEGFVKALAGRRTDPAARDEAFTSAQWASVGETAATLARVAAATSRGSGPTAELELEREEGRKELAEVDQIISTYFSQPSLGARDDEAMIYKFYQRSVRSILVQILTEEIAELDPAYDQLVRPRPLPLARVQALLEPDEALLFISPDDAGTSVFAVTGSAVEWHRSGLDRADMEKTVGLLREELAKDLRLVRDDGEDYFDRERSHGLYLELIAPLGELLAGKTRLMTVTPGPLSGLPLSLLVAGGADGNDPEFLIDRFEISTLPSVSSLFSLRCLLRDQASRPVVCGDQQGRPAVISGTGVELFAAGAPDLAGAPSSDRGVTSYSALFDRDLADPAKIMQMAYLPGTRREIDAVTAVVGQGRTVALIGKTATESAVKSDMALADARLVLFSTHGLLASETGLQGEPALVFTPPLPGKQSVTDDGLLTASEITQLKLSAEFVILSACNTASPDGGSDGDGLSGLAQAFFYAGAQSLLISHWPLNDDSGAAIVSEVFASLASNPEKRRSAAFREAILKIRRNPDWSSPALWAPFVLVGTTD